MHLMHSVMHVMHVTSGCGVLCMTGAGPCFPPWKPPSASHASEAPTEASTTSCSRHAPLAPAHAPALENLVVVQYAPWHTRAAAVCPHAPLRVRASQALVVLL